MTAAKKTTKTSKPTDKTALTNAALGVLRQKKAPVVIALGLVVVLLLAGMHSFLTSSHQKSPEFALQQLKTAIASQDAATATVRLNLDTLATSVLNQVYTPQLTGSTSPRGALGDALTQRIANLVIPTLAKTMATDLKTTIAKGSPETTENLILQRLWADFTGPDALALHKLEKTASNGNIATAKAHLERTDLEHKFTITLGLKKSDAGIWQVVDVPDFGLALATLLELQHAKKSATEAERTAAMNAALKLVALGLASRGGDNPALVAQIAFENTAGQTISAFSGNLLVQNSASQTIKTFAYGEQKPLPAGQVVEQAIPLPLVAEDPVDQALLANISDYSLSFQPVAIQFVDGTSLDLATE